jgi:hypothetical protein
MKLLFIHFFLTFLFGCSEKEICKEKLIITPKDDGYIIHIDNNNLIQIINDTLNITQLIFEDNKKINMDFYIIEPYLTGAYLCDIKEIGRMLMLESTPVGASGLSSQITNVSLIALDKNILWEELSYNSFYGGIDLLKYQNEKLILTIYDFTGYINDYDIIYCMSTFEFTETGFIPKKSGTCFIHTDKGLINKKDCICNYLETPYVCKSE